MDKVLFINACIRPNSRTLDLAKYALSKISGSLEEVKLYEEELSPLDLNEIELRDRASKLKDYSDKVFTLAKQFACADVVVIAAPYWDLMFPAVLKCYFEKVTVNGLTFEYGENGVPHGLCKAKKLVYATSSGGPIIHDFGYEYVSALAKGLYGIKKVQCLKAEGLDVFGTDVQSVLDKAKQSFEL